MGEKFSVSLELMIEKFKAKAKQAQDVSKNVSNKIKENMSVKPIFDIDTTNVKLVESRMQELNQVVLESQEIIQYGIQYPAWYSWNTETIQKAEKDLKSANAEIEYINSSLSTMNTNLDKNSKSSIFFGNSFNKIQDGMNKSLKSAKRFTLSLFGIQSVYRMLSRASSAYLAQDTETSSKIQSAWIGLGSVFAPLLNTIANFTIKAVSYINVFVKALTGTDFLANAMSKSMNKAGKSAGKLSKILAGFDEITNLDDDAGGASVDTSWIDAFEDVKLNPKITEFFEKLGKAMKPVYDGVKKVIEWFKALDSETQILMITLGTLGLLGLFFGAGGLIVGIGLLATGLYTYFSNTKDAKKETDNLKKAQEKLKKATDDLRAANKNLSDAIDTYESSVKDLTEAHEKLQKAQDRTGISGKELYGKVQNGTLTYWNMTDAQKEVYNLYLKIIEGQDDVAEATEKVNELTKEQTKAVQNQAGAYKETIDQLEIANSRLDENSDRFKDNQIEIDETKKKLKNLTGENYSTSLEVITKANTKQAEKDYSNFFSRLGTKFSNLMESIFSFSWLKSVINKISGGGGSGASGGGSGGGGFRGYAKGLDFVPYEGYYHLHPGETVVPAGFTPQMHGLNGNNNAETNKLLVELIDTLERKDMNAYISESEVGNASQNYRNKLSRIMGEELS